MSAPYHLKTKGLRVNIRTQGSGAKLLFLGGSNFDLAFNSRVFESPLAAHFTIAAADPRGLGGTDAPDGTWTMRDYAQDALDILDALGWDDAFVIGESFGAMTALHLAALAPQRIIRLALVVGAAGGAGGSSYPIETLRQIKCRHERAKTALSVMDKRFTHLVQSDPNEAEARISARVEAEAAFLANANNAQNHPRLLAARAGHDAWDHLPLIDIPTLVFAGRYDC
ncbi:MAG: alpha/beta hydrolase, partial [Octadecabacter sp.]|nr:alpha/beta hydrolase [Octadecabacter sp.]